MGEEIVTEKPVPEKPYVKPAPKPAEPVKPKTRKCIMVRDGVYKYVYE